MQFNIRRAIKFAGAVALLVIAIAAPAISNYLSHVEKSPSESPDQVTQDQQQTVSESIDTEPTAVTELPDIDSVNPTTEPLLYDFLAGCLDWHISIHRDMLDSDLYILRHSSIPGTLYTDWYPVQGGYTVPPLGTEIETVTLHPRDVARFDTIVDTIPSEYKVYDGEWELIIYAGDAATALNQLDMTFRDTYKYAESRQPPFVEDGTGWPTEWLRREPYATRLATESGLNISDTWWDSFALQGRYDLVCQGVPGDGYSYYAICTDVMQFSFCDDAGNVARGMSWDLLRESCNAMQADIIGIYEHGTWYPESE